MEASPPCRFSLSTVKNLPWGALGGALRGLCQESSTVCTSTRYFRSADSPCFLFCHCPPAPLH